MFDAFQPDKQKPVEAPYFEDITVSGGWEGMSTGKSFDKLKEEIEKALNLLDAKVTGFVRGTFGKRQGYRVSFILVTPDDQLRRGLIDIAALPNKTTYRRNYGSLQKRQEQSLKTSLYNIRDILEGMYRLRFLQPGFDPLMQWTLTDQGKTVGQLWNERIMSDHLLPSGKEEAFIDGEVREVR